VGNQKPNVGQARSRRRQGTSLEVQVYGYMLRVKTPHWGNFGVTRSKLGILLHRNRLSHEECKNEKKQVKEEGQGRRGTLKVQGALGVLEGIIMAGVPVGERMVAERGETISGLNRMRKRQNKVGGSPEEVNK